MLPTKFGDVFRAGLRSQKFIELQGMDGELVLTT